MPSTKKLLSITNLKKYFPIAKSSIFQRQQYYVKANEDISLDIYEGETLGIVGEYYWIARERGTIEAARNRASFPLHYTQAGERHEVTVRIRRNTTGGLGAAWTIDKVEPSTK